MDERVLENLLQGTNAINAGPNAREIFCMQADEEYKNGNILNAVFYQVMMLFQTFQMRYALVQPDDEMQPKTVKEIRANFNASEEEDFKSNKLMQYAYQELLKLEQKKGAVPKSDTKEKPFNFLLDVQNPQNGIRQIHKVCQMMPTEWTIIQLSKGSRTDTTYSVYNKIKEASAPIYLTILRHARSTKYSDPICLRFSGPEIDKLYENHIMIAKRFKESITVDPSKVNSIPDRKKYWKRLAEDDAFIEKTLKEFRQSLFPWAFLFTGAPLENTVARDQMDETFHLVDEFCNKLKWDTNERVLLSLAALHISSITDTEIRGISKALTTKEKEQPDVVKLLCKLKLDAGSKTILELDVRRQPSIAARNESQFYPCILIVDERLDHFYWEELNVTQEFCRVGSLHWLWRLQQHYKKNIKNGYLMMKVETGGCILNPDGSLPNNETRMKSFFKSWTPYWRLKCAEKPTHDELCKSFFNRDCYVYSGHGSGLQYVHGSKICKQEIKSIVFLFGCDSSTLRSDGLYSELIGSHCYYHAALCPAVIGCLLPGLDANMDTIATSIVSRWIPPHKNVKNWDEIDMHSWRKTGSIIEQKKSEPSKPISTSKNYNVGSLSEIISYVHQRRFDKKFYNTISYVYRGLPVWNSNAHQLLKQC